MKLQVFASTIAFITSMTYAAEGFKMRAVLEEDLDDISMEPPFEILNPENLTPPITEKRSKSNGLPLTIDELHERLNENLEKRGRSLQEMAEYPPIVMMPLDPA